PHGKIRNPPGLPPLGRYLVQAMMNRGMIIHIDHMSVKTAQSVLDMATAAHYPGVTSVHSWSDPSIIDRVLGLGGFVATYANAVPEFLSEWRTNRAAPHGNAIVGYGYGTDVNGLGDQANARPNAATSPLAYPFTAPNGTTVSRQIWGTRT